jgi:hypothetical protein
MIEGLKDRMILLCYRDSIYAEGTKLHGDFTGYGPFCVPL